LKKVTKLINN